MVGNVVSVTAAPARTSAPSGPAVDIASTGGLPQVGNNAPASGVKLPAAPPPPPVVDVARAIAQLNQLMSDKQRSVRFQVDVGGSGRTVITVINPTTNEVIRQIPSEELLSLQQSFGSLIDARA